MADKKILTSKPTLDKDLNKLAQVEQATGIVVKGLMGPGIAVIFIIMAMVFASAFVAGQSGFWITMAAAAVGGYMALNIGANDVANNVGPAVGSKAMTMGTALIIAAVFESTGALLAGGDVVNTISKGIIDVNTISDKNIFIAVMMAALVSSAVWVNIATWFGAPVSTTHSIVGGVMGAGIAAAGFDAVEWVTMGKIAASWVISPLLGGIIAAMFLAFIKEFIIYQDDKIAASKRWVPVLIAIMAAAFSAYLSVKGFKKIIKIDLSMALMIGA
ncbi:MAG: inorganic phosphate transporter, partial [Rhizobiales bacterium]|nr:inorganic phosphate transporter [Hyphomicrobiales bacterium]